MKYIVLFFSLQLLILGCKDNKSNADVDNNSTLKTENLAISTSEIICSDKGFANLIIDSSITTVDVKQNILNIKTRVFNCMSGNNDAHNTVVVFQLPNNCRILNFTSRKYNSNVNTVNEEISSSFIQNAAIIQCYVGQLSRSNDNTFTNSVDINFTAEYSKPGESMVGIFTYNSVPENFLNDNYWFWGHSKIDKTCKAGN